MQLMHWKVSYNYYFFSFIKFYGIVRWIRLFSVIFFNKLIIIVEVIEFKAIESIAIYDFHNWWDGIYVQNKSENVHCRVTFKQCI